MDLQQRTRRTLATGGVIAVLSIGAAIPALAQDATEEPTEETTPRDRTDEELGDFAAALAEERGDFAAALAEELGLDPATVETAVETVQTRLGEEREAELHAEMEERLAEAVAAGDLTQEQADALVAALEAGVLGDGPGGPGGQGPGGMGGPAGPAGLHGLGDMDGLDGMDGPDGMGGFGGRGGAAPPETPDAGASPEADATGV